MDNDQVSDELFPRTVNSNGDVVIEMTRRDGSTMIVTLEDLDGDEALKADAMIGSVNSPTLMLQTYAMFGLKSLVVDGTEVVIPPRKSDFNIKQRAHLFKNRELKMLMGVYAEEFMGNPSEAAIKNSSAPRSETNSGS